MWTVIYMAPNREMADKIRVLLSDEGLLVKLRKVNRCGKKKQVFYEIPVLESEAEEAHNILLEHLTC